MRAQHPVKFTAGKFFDVSLKSFADVRLHYKVLDIMIQKLDNSF